MTDAEIAKELTDDMLAVAEHLGFACPLIALGAAGLKLVVDAGFAAYFREAAKAVDAQRAAQMSGNAAAESQAATTAMERERGLKRICPPCAATYAGLIDAKGTP